MSLTPEAHEQTVARWRPRLLDAFREGKPLVVTRDEYAELLEATFQLDVPANLPVVEVQPEGLEPIAAAIDTSPITTITIDWHVQF